MECQKCKVDFPENEIELSHDVPCYLFEGNRKGQRNQADKWGRHNLCKECHKYYENALRNHLRHCSVSFSKLIFEDLE